MFEEKWLVLQSNSQSPSNCQYLHTPSEWPCVFLCLYLCLYIFTSSPRYPVYWVAIVSNADWTSVDCGLWSLLEELGGTGLWPTPWRNSGVTDQQILFGRSRGRGWCGEWECHKFFMQVVLRPQTTTCTKSDVLQCNLVYAHFWKYLMQDIKIFMP